MAPYFRVVGQYALNQLRLDFHLAGRLIAVLILLKQRIAQRGNGALERDQSLPVIGTRCLDHAGGEGAHFLVERYLCRHEQHGICSAISGFEE